MEFKKLQGYNFLKVPQLVAGSTGCGPRPYPHQENGLNVNEIERAIKVDGLEKSEALEYIKLQINVHPHYLQQDYSKWEKFIDEIYLKYGKDRPPQKSRFQILKEEDNVLDKVNG